MQFTKKTLFAIEVVLDIAHYITSNPLQSKDISKNHNVSYRYLETILQKLVKIGILKSIKGPKGGYVLAKERRKITLADIVCAVNALESAESFAVHSKDPLFFSEYLYPLWQQMYEDNIKVLKAITLQHICDSERYMHKRKIGEAESVNFSI